MHSQTYDHPAPSQTSDRQVKRMMGTFYRPWYRRPLPWLALLLLGVVAGRLALTPLVDRTTREALAELPSFHVHYRGISMFSFPPVVVMDGVTVDGLDGKRVVSIERVEAHSTWREVARAVVFNQTPTIRLRVVRPTVTLAGDALVFLASEIESWLEGRRTAYVELASIEQGELKVGDRQGTQAEAWMTDVTASFENFRGADSPVMKGKAALLGSGEALFTVKLPTGEGAAVTGELGVSYLSLADLYLFLGATPARDTTGATVALSSRFTVADGQVSGALRTSTVGVHPGDLPEAQLAQLRTRLSGAAPWIAGQRQATHAPAQFTFRGTLSPAGSRPWVQALSITRSLFVEGVSGAMSALPAATPPAAVQEAMAGAVTAARP